MPCGELTPIQKLNRHDIPSCFPTLRRYSMRTVIILAAFAASLLAAGCNTVAGAGRDVSSAGHAVTDTAKDAAGH